MSLPQIITQNLRLVSMAVLVAGVMVAIYLNNSTGGSFGLDKSLSISGISKNLLFYGAVFGFISLSRSGRLGGK